MIMKALSLHEPWASLMRTGAKTIETRSWGTMYRGPLLICASATCSRCMLCYQIVQNGLAPLQGKPLDLQSRINHGIRKDDLWCGFAVAIVDLLECVQIENFEFNAGDERVFGDYCPGRFAWVTSNRRIFTPFPVKGRQRLFNVDVHDSISHPMERSTLFA